MPEFMKSCTEIVAVLVLGIIGFLMVSNSIDGTLLMLDIVAIAGIAGYKIGKLPSPPTLPKS